MRVKTVGGLEDCVEALTHMTAIQEHVYHFSTSQPPEEDSGHYPVGCIHVELKNVNHKQCSETPHCY